MDLLSTAPDQRLPVRALIVAGEVFEFSDNRVRVALCRLRELGTVESPARGEYRLTARALEVNAHVSRWRTRGRERVKWRGGFVMAHGASGDPRALRLLGLRPRSATLWLRPDNLRGGAAALRERALAFGLDGWMIGSLDDLDAAERARALDLWDVDAIVARHRDAREALERSERRLDRLAPRDALRESFVRGGDAIRAVVLDPLLPDALCDPAPRRALVEAMKRYDAVGRRLWRDHLEIGLGRRAPIDARALRDAYVGAGA